jgi:hypothetical protein
MKVYHDIERKLQTRKTDVSKTHNYYQGNIVRRTVSKYFYSNPTMEWLLDSIEPLFTQMMNNIKLIKKFHDPSIHKKDNFFN